MCLPSLRTFANKEFQLSSSSRKTAQHGSGEVALKLSMLESLHSHNETADTSSYAMNGCDSSRLKTLLENGACDCKCSLPYEVISRVCSSFWKLPKENQDALLWSMQCEAGRGMKNKFSIEGRLHVFTFIFWAATTNKTKPIKI